MKFIVALTIVSVVCGQGPEQQPQHQDQFLQMENHLTQQQFEQMMEQNPSFRAAPIQPLTQQQIEQQNERSSGGQQQPQPQVFVVQASESHDKPHHQQQQILFAEVVQPQKQQHQQQEKIVLQLGQSPPQKQQEKIILQLGNKQEQVILGQNNPQVIKLELEEHHKPKPPPQQSFVKHCHMLGRKGECTSIPSFFSCIRDGAILAPAFSECSFIQACCIRNFFSQN